MYNLSDYSVQQKLNKPKNPNKPYFPDRIVLTYLRLKAAGKTKKEIIEIVDLCSTYIEQRLRLYILKEMACRNVIEAVCDAYKLGWID